jgi:hypothetical protein
MLVNAAASCVANEEGQRAEIILGLRVLRVACMFCHIFNVDVHKNTHGEFQSSSVAVLAQGTLVRAIEVGIQAGS